MCVGCAFSEVFYFLIKNILLLLFIAIARHRKVSKSRLNIVQEICVNFKYVFFIRMIILLSIVTPGYSYFLNSIYSKLFPGQIIITIIKLPESVDCAKIAS